MACSRLLSSARNNFLKFLNHNTSQQATVPPLAFSFYRAMSEGTFLDKDSVTERVLNVVRHFEKVDPAKVTPSASFDKDLGLDSLDAVEVVMAMEEEFAIEIPDAEADRISTTAEAIDYISSHPQAK